MPKEPTTIMFRREHLSVGQFNPKFTWLPNWEMWPRLLNAGDCYIIVKPLAYIRNHSRQVIKMVVHNYITYFEEYHLYKALKRKKEYTIDINDINIDELIKRKR